MIWGLLYALVGLAVGSFLNVVIDRVPAEEALTHPPSRCPSCGRRLTPGELVPVLSYLVLRGRCRTCGDAIPLRVPLVEAATALLFGFLWWRYGASSRLGLTTVFSAILLVLMVIDLEHRIVPNIIVLPAIALALLAIPVQGLLLDPVYGHYAFPLVLLSMRGGWSPSEMAMLSQLGGGVLAFLIFFLLWVVAPRGMGAGDVKLAALAGLLTGLPGALVAVFGSFLLGGAVGSVLLLTGLANRKTAVPFAPFIVITTFLVMIYVDEIVGWYLGYLLG